MIFEVIVDKLVSKKNDVSIYCRNNIPIKYKDEKIRFFEADCVAQLKTQKIRQKFTTIEVPVKIKYTFEINSRITVRDKDNMEASINDVLQLAGIIKNDALIYKSCSEKVLKKGQKEKAIIEIEKI